MNPKTQRARFLRAGFFFLRGGKQTVTNPSHIHAEQNKTCHWQFFPSCPLIDLTAFINDPDKSPDLPANCISSVPS